MNNRLIIWSYIYDQLIIYFDTSLEHIIILITI